MSLAVVLLLGAMLFVRTFVALRRVDRGFHASQVVTMNMSLSGAFIGLLLASGLVPLLLTVTAAAAVSMPAHRATRVDPMTSLRSD